MRPSTLSPGLVPPFGPPRHLAFPSGHRSWAFIALLLLAIPGIASYGTARSSTAARRWEHDSAQRQGRHRTGKDLDAPLFRVPARSGTHPANASACMIAATAWPADARPAASGTASSKARRIQGVDAQASAGPRRGPTAATLRFQTNRNTRRPRSSSLATQIGQRRGRRCRARASSWAPGPTCWPGRWRKR